MGSRVSIRSVGILVALVGSVALVPSSGHSPPDFGEPLAGLTPEQLERFEEGEEEFAEVETVPERARSRLQRRFLRHLSLRTRRRRGQHTPGDAIWPDALQRAVRPPLPVRRIADSGTRNRRRRGLRIPGRGRAPRGPDRRQAADDASLRARPRGRRARLDVLVARVLREVQLGPRRAGIVSVVTNLATGKQAAGKFGWKGQNPTLFISRVTRTSTRWGSRARCFPTRTARGGDCDSLCLQPAAGHQRRRLRRPAFADFMTFLAPPPRGPMNGAAFAGERKFDELGLRQLPQRRRSGRAATRSRHSNR